MKDYGAIRDELHLALRYSKSDMSTSAMVSELTFRSMLLLFVLTASITVCFSFLIVVLVLLCMLLNLGSRLIMELMILKNYLD